ncbi:hypothetical protein NMY22_g19480 [Coprinellus aureogranulatus]|nr:hypothetical protein NMY22_g19480 [Coprinellus aureogranulatus]
MKAESELIVRVDIDDDDIYDAGQADIVRSDVEHALRRAIHAAYSPTYAKEGFFPDHHRQPPSPHSWTQPMRTTTSPMHNRPSASPQTTPPSSPPPLIHLQVWTIYSEKGKGRNQHKPNPPIKELEKAIALFYFQGKTDKEILQELHDGNYFDKEKYGLGKSKLWQYKNQIGLVGSRKAGLEVEDITNSMVRLREMYPWAGARKMVNLLLTEGKMKVQSKGVNHCLVIVLSHLITIIDCVRSPSQVDHFPVLPPLQTRASRPEKKGSFQEEGICFRWREPLLVSGSARQMEVPVRSVPAYLCRAILWHDTVAAGLVEQQQPRSDMQLLSECPLVMVKDSENPQGMRVG